MAQSQQEMLIHEMCDEMEEDLRASLYAILEKYIDLSVIEEEAQEVEEKAEQLRRRAPPDPVLEIVCFWVGVLVTIGFIVIIVFLVDALPRYLADSHKHSAVSKAEF